MSLTAKSVVWFVNSYRPVPELEGAQFKDRLYGAPCVVFTHVSIAGDANEEPVPLIGAGVVFALSASEVFSRGDDLKAITGSVPFTEVVVVTPVAPVVLVVVVLGLLVVVVPPSAPAVVPMAATATADSNHTPTTRRHHPKVFKCP
jgi:hypothetical protein